MQSLENFVRLMTGSKIRLLLLEVLVKSHCVQYWTMHYEWPNAHYLQIVTLSEKWSETSLQRLMLCANCVRKEKAVHLRLNHLPEESIRN